MGGKSKKNKPARSIDVASHQPRDNVEAVRQVYRRLRKGIDLKTLSKEAENLEKIKPSAITRLCRAKVDLSLAADTLRDKNLYELHSRTTSGVFREIRLKIVEVIKLTREGALDHNSLLCGRLCAKLALVLGYKLEDFELSRKHEELQDPNSEVVEQDKDLCDFEKWNKKKDVTGQKMGLRVEIQMNVQKAAKDYGVSDVLSLANGLMQAGVLLPNQRSSLETLLSAKHKQESRLNQFVKEHEFDQLLATPGLHTLSLENSKSVPDEGDSAKRKGEEQKNRNSHKQADPDAEPLDNTSTEVLAYVSATLGRLEDNDARLVALQELSTVPLQDISKIYLEQMGDKAPKEIGALKYLVPAEGSVVTSSLVMMDYDMDMGLSFPQVLDRTKRQILEKAEEQQLPPDEAQLNTARVAEQAFLGWGVWPGHAPTALTPLDVMEFEEYMRSLPRDAFPVPLNKPAPIFSEAVSSVLHTRLAGTDRHVDKSIVDSVVKTQLSQLLACGGSGRHTLTDLTAKSMAQMTCSLFGEPPVAHMLDTGLAEMGGLDLKIWLGLSVSEVGKLAGKEMEQLAVRKGQLAVTLAELNDQSDEDCDTLEFGKKFRKAFNLWQDAEPFEDRLESDLVNLPDLGKLSDLVEQSDLLKQGSTDEGEAEDYQQTESAAEGYTKLLASRLSDGLQDAIAASLDNHELQASETEMRKAALKELVLAVQLLVDGQQFTPGIATAVCGHIQHALHEMRLLNEMGLPSTDIYIEHAQLLPLGPLRELLHFLWVHIGLRFNALPAVEHWRQRLRQFDEGMGLLGECFWEIHSGGFARYSAAYLQRLWTCALFSQMSGDDEQTADKDFLEDTQVAAKPVPDEILLKASQKPVVEEVLLKQLVNSLYTQEEHVHDHVSPEENEARELDAAQIHQETACNALTEAVTAVNKLTEQCAELVEAMDAALPEPQLPLQVDDSDIQGLPEAMQDNSMLIKQAVAAEELSQYASNTLNQMELQAAETEHMDRINHYHRVFKLHTAVNSYLRLMIGHIGGFLSDSLLNMVKSHDLYDPHLLRVQGVLDQELDAVMFGLQTASEDARHWHKQKEAAEIKAADTRKHVVNNLRGFYEGGGTVEDFWDESQLHLRVQTLSRAADKIAAMQLRMDILAMQVQSCCKEAARGQCVDLHSILYQGQQGALGKKLAQQAKQYKEETKQQAADKTMQELLADESKSQAAAGGTKKGKRKKKAAAKLQEGKTDIEDQQSVQEAVAEEAAEEAGLLADTADSSFGLLQDSSADLGASSAPMSDTNGFGDYQLQLRDGAVEEDWSTVNKKSKAKAASKQEAASDSALQGSTSGTAPVKAPELDPDGWEMAPNLVLPNISKQPSEDNSWNTVNKKDRKAKALSQNAQAASDDARNSKAPDGWDGDADEEFEDAASSLSDPFGSSKAPSTSRPGSAVDRQPSKQNDRQQSRQSLKSPSKQLGASGSDVQCHKCGVYGHMAANCDDKYCDYCEKPGHQIAQCDRHKEFLSKQNQMPAKQHQAFVKDNQRGARQDQQPFRQGQGPGNSDRESGHPNVPYYPNTCFGCGQYGHKKINCPHPPPGRRSMHQNQNIAPLSSQQPPPPPRQHDPRAAAQSVTTTDADVQKPTPEQVQGRGRGPEPDTEAPQPRKVVPVKPTRPAAGVSMSDQQLNSEFPDLQSGNAHAQSGNAHAQSGNAHMPPGVPMPGSTEPQRRNMPQSPQSTAWGPPARDNMSQSTGQRGTDRHQPLSAHAQSSGSSQTGSDHHDQGTQYHSTFNGSHGVNEHLPPHLMHTFPPGRGQTPAPFHQTGAFPQHDTQAPVGPPFDQGNNGPWGNSGHSGQPVFHQNMQPGTHSQNFVGAAMHSTGAPNLHVMGAGDQMSAQHDPVVSPHLLQRGAVVAAATRTYQPASQSSYQPNAPLIAFAHQEASQSAEPNEEDQFMNDIFAQNAEDNDSDPLFGAYAPPNHAQYAVQPDQKAWGAPNSLILEQEDDEDAQMQRAVQESMSEQNTYTQQQQQLDLYNSNRVQTSTSNGSSAGAGLRNATGEYNCFLNVIIQCLWRCQAFRKQIMQWDLDVYQDNDIVATLMDLFGALDEKEQQQLGGAVDPNPLREALSSYMDSDFRMGQMHDASEVLLTLYANLSKVAASNNQPHLLDRIFGLDVREAVQCEDCSKESHVHQYTQYFFTVIAAAISAVCIAEGNQELGLTLQAIEGQTQKSCDSDVGGCGNMRSVQLKLNSVPPKVFTMQLAWQSANETRDEIAQTLGALREELDLSQVYHNLREGEHVYRIRSMVCYYGQHYMAVALLGDSKWYMFDDATVQLIGQWSDVVKKCVAGRTQPSVLFFEGM